MSGVRADSLAPCRLPDLLNDLGHDFGDANNHLHRSGHDLAYELSDLHPSSLGLETTAAYSTPSPPPCSLIRHMAEPATQNPPDTRNPFAVIAATRADGERFARHELLDLADIEIVHGDTSPDRLLGRRFRGAVYIPGWDRHERFAEVQQAVQMAVR